MDWSQSADIFISKLDKRIQCGFISERLGEQTQKPSNETWLRSSEMKSSKDACKVLH